jgi:hypothetical protein
MFVNSTKGFHEGAHSQKKPRPKNIVLFPFFKGIAVQAIMYIDITTYEYSRLHSIQKIAMIKNNTARGGHQGRFESLFVAL